MAKYRRKLGLKFAKKSLNLARLDPLRAYKTLKSLRDRAIVEDARTTRQSGGITPPVLSALEFRAVNDAVKLLNLRNQMLHERKAS